MLNTLCSIISRRHNNSTVCNGGTLKCSGHHLPKIMLHFVSFFQGFQKITVIIIGEERKCVRLETRAANLSGWTTPGRKRVGVAAMLIQPSLMLLLAVWSQEKEIDKMGLITWIQKWITSRIKPRNLFWADRAQDDSRTRRGGLCACYTDAWRSHSHCFPDL